MTPKTDCYHFDGYKPCAPHKKHGVHCDTCKFYRKLSGNILIIKLQAAGEVIRNTPILHRLNALYPDARIYWLTRYPELVPEDRVYRVLRWNSNVILFLVEQEFDLLFNLDKDPEACSLANLAHSKVKKGFTQKDGIILPFDKDAEHKWLTGIFDDAMRKNTRNYVEELYDICGLKWQGEKYILPRYTVPAITLPKTGKKIIGIPTGVGAKWITRKFSEGKLVSLIGELLGDYEVILLGGPEEDEVNKKIASFTGAKYYGTFTLKEFIGLVSLCDLVITPATMTLHIAIGLEKKIILLNNIFPTNEFHLYNLGEILEPEMPCKYCYKSRSDERCHSKNCLDTITNETLINTTRKLLEIR